MKNKLLLSFFIFVCISATIYAQQATPPSLTIKGTLLDSLTQEGEVYATIKIEKKSDPGKAVKMTVTDARGKFQEKINATIGDYVIALSSIGKTTVVKNFTVNPEDKIIDLGILYTSDMTSELKGVEVVAQKPLVKVDIDKIEYNIQDDPDSKTNNVLEMLRKVPLVTVDGEDNIKVNGSSSFKIHVNGKANNMMSTNPVDVLKSMPATTIKYIEVITNPGAKYDAEGVGGILNIVTLGSGFEGYTATFRANAGNRDAGAGGYATIQKGKLTFSANYSYSKNLEAENSNESKQENFTSDEQKYLRSIGTNNLSGSFQNGSVEASYEVDTLRLITLAFGMYGGGHNSEGYGKTEMQSATLDPTYSYTSRSNGNGSWYSVRGNVDYQRSFKNVKDRRFTLSYNINTRPSGNDSYSRYENLEGNLELLQPLNLLNRRSEGSMNTSEHTFQSDYTTPIGKLHTIEVGAKYIIRNNVSDDKYYAGTKMGNNDYQYDENRSSHYEHLNDILAAYLGYTLRYKDFSFKPGLRYEYTAQAIRYLVGKGEDFKTDFNDLVPSATLGIKLNETQNLRGGYNMRIWRPSIYNLNPYFNDQNPMRIRQGNPNLESEKSHSFNLNYSSFTSKFSFNASIRYSFNNNGIEQVTRIVHSDGEVIDGHQVAGGALYNTYANIGKSRNTSLGLYANWNASPKTRIYLNSSGEYSDIKSPSQGLHNFGWWGSLSGGIQHTFPLSIRASLNAGGSTPYISLQEKGSGYYYYSLNINRSFLKNERLTLSIFGNNLHQPYRSFNNTTFGENFSASSSYRHVSRYYGMSVSYRIGELKASVKKAARSISNDDVKGDNSANP